MPSWMVVFIPCKGRKCLVVAGGKRMVVDQRRCMALFVVLQNWELVVLNSGSAREHSQVL